MILIKRKFKVWSLLLQTQENKSWHAQRPSHKIWPWPYFCCFSGGGVCFIYLSFASVSAFPSMAMVQWNFSLTPALVIIISIALDVVRYSNHLCALTRNVTVKIFRDVAIYMSLYPLLQQKAPTGWLVAIQRLYLWCIAKAAKVWLPNNKTLMPWFKLSVATSCAAHKIPFHSGCDSFYFTICLWINLFSQHKLWTSEHFP